MDYYCIIKNVLVVMIQAEIILTLKLKNILVKINDEKSKK